MALRMLRYISEFYDHILRTGKPDKLPAVFPLVLYNGARQWNTPLSVEDMIEQTIPATYMPRMSYYKIAENEFSKETLQSLHNVIAAVFYVENINPDELEREIDRLIEIIRREKLELVTIFTNWLKNYFGDSEPDGVERIYEIEEVKDMLAVSLKKRDEQMFNHGIEKGIEKGRDEERQHYILKMLEKGYSVMEIAELSGLPVDVVEKMRH